MTSRTATVDRPKNSAAIKRKEKRDGVFPDADRETWTAKGNKGFVPLPRTLPLIAEIANGLSTEKAGGVYLALWFRDFGEGFIEADDPSLLAFEAGYSQSPARAARSWNDRINILAQHGFIKTAQRGNRPNGYILLRDPYRAASELHAAGKIAKATWDYLRNRCLEIGVDLDDYRTPGVVAAGEGE